MFLKFTLACATYFYKFYSSTKLFISNRATFLVITITKASSTNTMEMDIVTLVSVLGYAKDAGKLLIRGGKKRIKILHPNSSSGLSLTVQPHLWRAKKHFCLIEWAVNLCILQPVYSDAPDVAAVSSIPSASAQHQVSRRCVKGHTPELCMPQLGKSIAFTKKEPLLHKVTTH